MVICQYFLNNNCHFKTNCKNEHIDVKSTIKQEADQAIRGKQWPLSCFSPFKEKTNLIPDESDVSYEEIRVQYIEARASNTLHLYEQQLLQKIQEANNCLQALFNCNKDIISAAVNIYNADSGQSQPKPGFGGGAFGSTTAATNSNAFSIFGGGTAQPAAQSVFGGSTGGSIFGNASSTPQNAQGSSIFGGPSAPQQTSSIFGSGMSTFSQPANSNTGIFGGSSGFGSAAPASSIFGGGTTAQSPPQSAFGSAFGAKPPAFGTAAPQPASGFGTFASQPQQPAAPSFGQTSSLFGQQAPPAFGSQTAFGTQQAPLGLASAQPPSTGLFSQSTFGSTTSPPSQSVFGSNQNPPAQSAFGSAFSQPSQPPTFEQSQSNSVFGGSAFSNPQQQQQQPPSSNPFGSFASAGQPTAQPFGMASNAAPAQAVAAPQVAVNNSLYSSLEELTAQQRAAFEAGEFVLGQIPNVPPPKELCF